MTMMNRDHSPRIRTLIAEDEPLAAESLAEWVGQLPQLELVAVCNDGASALAQIRALQPGLVLMDIQMPGMTGLQVLRALAQQPNTSGPAVIFTTAYDEHALTAFELHAVDYLLKPFSHDRFVEAVEHALQVLERLDGAATNPTLNPALEALEHPPEAPLTRILVRDQGKIFPLHVDAIEYLRSDAKYTAIASRGRQFLVRLPISSFEQRLDPQRFLKLQRSCIVNLDCVEAMTPDESSQLVVQMRDGTRFTASREVSKKLREQSI
ncbi:LytTR family DNA-binding domain-containing protein [Paucibacter sp. PLA-PC-4]|uniref:LytR/AlgR family response regulator transcription factor n=1 Tax=Paucibacter sp. PLA-PC-4 TaxID=2993655 RepID=UPI002248E1BD|nr:LytTR family DNA-binding domain-containing protein [Paucibacter sp. PLA-PC-4]MCX2862011.1 LytTR family DNA-binding domain-containing protein [Paucibacter sp. PLA-PC-4]